MTTHTDSLAREGFLLILWEVLQGVGYTIPPQYEVQLFEEHRVPHCRVRMTLEPHPLQPGWHSLDSESFSFWVDDTIESMAMHVLTIFYGFDPLEMLTHLIGLFPAEKENDPMWKDRVDHAKDVWALYPGHTTHLTVRCMKPCIVYRPCEARQCPSLWARWSLPRSPSITGRTL
jgi:hypothetical protein